MNMVLASLSSNNSGAKLLLIMLLNCSFIVLKNDNLLLVMWKINAREILF